MGPPPECIYYPEVDVENLEEYVPGGFHPTSIGDTFCDGRYTIVHKLGFGGYSTIWLARDHQSQRYVSLKIEAASSSGSSPEGNILRSLQRGPSTHMEKRFVPPLLDQFTFEGPNGQHLCLVGVPFGCSISTSKENSVDFMFPAEAARSIAAQLIRSFILARVRNMPRRYRALTSRLLQGLTELVFIDLHIRNFLLRIPNLDSMTTIDLYERFGKPGKTPVRRVDRQAPEPHAPTHVIYPMRLSLPANKIFDPEIVITDYGTSFFVSQTPSPTLHTPALYLPPENFFGEPITPAADVWTLGVNLYEVLGERPLFETFAWDRDDIMGEMINTLGRPPARWWDSWTNRGEFFRSDGGWISDFKRISTPVFRPLHQRLWDMGRGETPESCQWDVAGGELQALEDLLKGMLAFELAERLTAEQLMTSDYMINWALPAWERHVIRMDSIAA